LAVRINFHLDTNAKKRIEEKLGQSDGIMLDCNFAIRLGSLKKLGQKRRDIIKMGL